MATFLRRTSDYCSLCDSARFKAPLLPDQEEARMNRNKTVSSVVVFSCLWFSSVSLLG